MLPCPWGRRGVMGAPARRKWPLGVWKMPSADLGLFTNEMLAARLISIQAMLLIFKLFSYESGLDYRYRSRWRPIWLSQLPQEKEQRAK